MIVEDYKELDMNLELLDFIIKYENHTYRECAKVIGKSEAQFGKKIHGSQDFYIDELEKLGLFLDISPKFMGMIAFSNKNIFQSAN